MKKLILFMSALSVISGAVASPVPKWYPGAMCKPADSESAKYIYLNLQSGAIEKSRYWDYSKTPAVLVDGTARVVCPVVRSQDNSYSIRRSFVSLKGSYDKIHCGIYSYQPDGTLGGTAEVISDSNAANGYYWYWFPNYIGNTRGSDFVLTCEFGSGSQSLLYYFVEETN